MDAPAAPISAKCLRASVGSMSAASQIRRNVEHADARASLRRRENQARFGRLARTSVDPDRRLLRIPDLVKGGTDVAADTLHAVWWRIAHDDRLALVIVSCHDSSECWFHRALDLYRCLESESALPGRTDCTLRARRCASRFGDTGYLHNQCVPRVPAHYR